MSCQGPASPVRRRLAALLAACAALPACRAEPAGADPGAGASPAGRSANEGRLGDADLRRAEELYGRHCELCHGRDGTGEGPAAPYLFPPPRDFTTAKLRLTRVRSGLPPAADLVATLRRGFPGSAMPSWGWMPERDLDLLARYVRHLAEQGLVRELLVEERFAGLPASELEELARARLAPGPPVELGDLPRPRDLDHGRRLFLERCASCHGTDGTGTPEPRRNTDGSFDRARDFTSGVLAGPGTLEALATRILLGMPGSAMPLTEIDDRQDLADLAGYVRSLVPPGVEDDHVLRRGYLAVRRVDAVPESAEDPAWRDVEELEVVLAPLAWSDTAVFRARVSALHDGTRLALRVSWRDPSGPTPVLVGGAPDALAVQLSTASEPPLFGMGTPEHPTDVWHWRSRRPGDDAGVFDALPDDLLLVGPGVHAIGRAFRGEARLDVPIYLPERERAAVSQEVLDLRASGLGELAQGSGGPPATPVRAVAAHDGGGWSLVLTRALAPASDQELAFGPEARIQLALAVWNGGAGDAGAHKSISVWQELALAP